MYMIMKYPENTNTFYITYVYVCILIYLYTCVCVVVCVCHTHTQKHTHNTHSYRHRDTHTQTCVCVCVVCVCVVCVCVLCVCISSLIVCARTCVHVYMSVLLCVYHYTCYMHVCHDTVTDIICVHVHVNVHTGSPKSWSHQAYTSLYQITWSACDIDNVVWIFYKHRNTTEVCHY